MSFHLRRLELWMVSHGDKTSFKKRTWGNQKSILEGNFGSTMVLLGFETSTFVASYCGI